MHTIRLAPQHYARKATTLQIFLGERHTSWTALQRCVYVGLLAVIYRKF